MPLTGRELKKNEEGIEKDCLEVSFTNGALEQLKELKAHFDLKDLTEVVSSGIGVLQRIKELNDKEKSENKEKKDIAPTS